MRALLLAGALLALAGAVAWRLLAPPPLEVPAAGVVLRHVTLVEPGRGAREDRTLTVVADRIEAIAPSRPDEPPGPFAGRFVAPGLIDLHVHHPPAVALGERSLFDLLFLLHGVTSVRDTGDVLGSLWEQRRRVAAGETPGPRIFSCGTILDGPSPVWPGTRVVEDAPQGQRAVEELARAGADCVKVYNDLSPEAYRAIVDAAAARGLPVVAHVPWSVPLPSLGRVEVQHLMGLTDDWEEVPPQLVRWYVHVSQATGISHTPTLVTFARAAELDQYERLAASPLARLLPRYWRRLVWNPSRNPLVAELSPAGGGDARSRIARMMELVGALHAAGVPVLAGTDTPQPFVVPGAGLHEELRLLAEAGLGLEGAWAAATRKAGEALRVPGLGTLEPGAPADLLVLREDPTRHLEALSTLEAVVAAGRLYRREALEQALAEQRAHFDGFPYRSLSEAAAALLLRLYQDEPGDR